MLIIAELLSLQLDVIHRSHNIADIERIKEGSDSSISREGYKIIKTECLCSGGLGSSHVWSLGYTQTFKTYITLFLHPRRISIFGTTVGVSPVTM